jgi:glycosyltransferase involved in cell wall biosynthesis
VESVLAQSFPNWELVVADNGSTQESGLVVAAFGDPRIRHLRNEWNLGLTGNLSRCLELARGEYVTILVDDDLLLPEHLARKVLVLDAHPSVGFAHSNIFHIDRARHGRRSAESRDPGRAAGRPMHARVSPGRQGAVRRAARVHSRGRALRLLRPIAPELVLR